MSPAERKRGMYLRLATQSGNPKYLKLAGDSIEQPSAFAEKLNLMGYQAGTPEYTQAAQKLAMRPSTQVTVNQPPTGYGIDPQDPSRLQAIPGGPADPRNPRNITGQQRTASGYLERMQAAEKLMAEITAAGFDPASYTEAARGITNFTASPGYRQYSQAQADWVRAKLRLESGAVIAESEMDAEVATYFPQPGDDPLTKAQKKEARKMAEKQLSISAGSTTGNKRYVFGGKRP